MLGGNYNDETLQFALLYLSPTNDLEALAKAIPKAARGALAERRLRYEKNPFKTPSHVDIKTYLRKILAPATVDAPDQLTGGYRSEA